MAIFPEHDYLLIALPEKNEPMSKGGLVLVQNDERPETGTVLECGPDCEFGWVGKRVMFKKYSGVDLQIGDSKMLLIQAKDVIASFSDD